MVLPMDYGQIIPDDEPVRILDALLEELDYTELLHLYPSTKGRKLRIPPVILFKIIVFSMMEGHYSLRDMEHQCRYNIQYLWLLEGRKAPSHMTIGRFLKRLPLDVLEHLFTQLVGVLSQCDSITWDEVYIDGTKLEANANRYTAVWKKQVKYSLGLLQEKREALQDNLLALLSMDTTAMTDDELLAVTAKACEEAGITIVHGAGHRQSKEQKLLQAAMDIRDKQQDLDEQMETLRKRNSYSRTDHDATFMRMKDDHTKKGQPKAAYNIQIAVESEYIVGVAVGSNPADQHTLIPFLKQLRRDYGKLPAHVVADAGYDSEANLDWLNRHGCQSVIKPHYYEHDKTAAAKKDISRADNMTYDADRDEYICAKGRRLSYKETYTRANENGYVQEFKVYECEKCSYCSYRKQCQKMRGGKKPQHNKIITQNLHYLELQKDNKARFQSEAGIQLRINRSIQVEGTFGVIKEDFDYRRIHRRGEEGVLKELLMISFGFNVRKLVNRVKKGRVSQRFLDKEKTAC